MISTPKSQRQADLYEFKARVVYREFQNSQSCPEKSQKDHGALALTS